MRHLVHTLFPLYGLFLGGFLMFIAFPHAFASAAAPLAANAFFLTIAVQMG